jgi:hypothetical protein
VPRIVVDPARVSVLADFPVNFQRPSLRRARFRDREAFPGRRERDPPSLYAGIAYNIPVDPEASPAYSCDECAKVTRRLGSNLPRANARAGSPPRPRLDVPES